MRFIMRYSYFPIIVMLLSLFTGCSTDDAPGETDPPAELHDTAVNSVAGLTWEVPANWRAERQRPMRVATYSTPSAEGEQDMGEVAIFYFGPGEGGSVEANIERWFGQFEHPDLTPQESAPLESMIINGIPVTIVRTSGTYTAAAGPMAPQQDVRPGYMLIGAIAEGPQGAVFFKFTGPETTVQEAESDFMRLVESIRRQ